MSSVIAALDDDEKYLAAILMDESGIDIAEFLWHEPSNSDGCFRARPYQWGWWRSNDTFQVDLSARALDLDTPIPTPSGWSTMGALRPGDFVFDDDGHPVAVLSVSQVWDGRPCFEVCFDDHTSIVADADHLWATWDKTARMARRPGRYGTPAPQVRSTRDIAASLTYGRKRPERNHSVDLTKPLQGTGPLPVDPYYLGYWLGDGNSRTPEVTTADTWVLDELRRRHFEIHDRSKALLYGVDYSRPHNRKTQSLQADLRRLGVLLDKHIPQAYLRACESERRDLLAGLVDSDGHMQTNGSCEITQKAQPLAEGILELLRSLGEKPRITKRTAFLNGVDCGPVYRVAWRPRVNPAKMPRKAAAFVAADTRQGFALGQRRIVEVREVSSRPVRCISVASDSHLFLAGEGMVPTHNTVGKSLSISLRGFAHVFCNPGQEMLITAPELIHLEPVVNLIEHRLSSTRLSREMLPRGRGAITHRPFLASAINGARIFGRIPQRDGRGVKGAHPLWLELDESQDYPEKGYKELIEGLLREEPNAVWRCHGVTNGVGGWFYDITQAGINTAPLRDTPKKQPEDWTVHRMVAMVREGWTDEERAEKIQKYGGSREAPDYLRNVLGQHGPASNVIFVLQRLMKCVDDNLSSAYNQDEYFKAEIRDGDLMREGTDILDFLDFPHSLKKYKTYWIGMDVGYVNDPTEILVFAEYTPTASELNVKDDDGEHKARPQDGVSRLKLVARVSLHRIKEPDQVEVMLHMIDWFKPQAYALDKTGSGLPLYQNVMERLRQTNDKLRTQRSRQAMDCIKGYGFSEKILVDFDDSVDVAVGATIDDQVKEAGIHRMVLEVSTDVLRTYVDTERFWFPWDENLLGQFSGQTFTYSRATRDLYGRRRLFSQGDFHCLDAARMAALGHKQFAIEALVNAKEPETDPVLDLVITHDMMAEWR